MNQQLSPSEWTVSEARSLTAQLRQVATTAAEYDGIELFTALCDYLDQLYGGPGFDALLPEPDRVAMAGLIQGIRGRAATGSVVLDDHGVPVDLSTTEGDPAYDTLVRLAQPVNAAVTLAQGRRLAAELGESEGWQRELGRALQGLYTYLDQLYGGSGAFTELLTPEERVLVAQRKPKR
ncbi:hypothetical protein EV644_110122 [Kribbella orskensis]|uniref:SUKH-4 immunity protein of toxin-antitoxin system n=1 Tax=Kribbella orskensis TaxID=2512216 RepID=A0ABY2BGF9_9ACTN|nr:MULTISPECIES: hypothetical protein [Kribbella]TCN37988.1 hypothetical protein EV642_110145 [Kribbella sp. VKM Ac-2500]TCO19474.1 hypothetical protein EV644_110122 [Kribbella orskensis]